jgi:hypothetical protein
MSVFRPIYISTSLGIPNTSFEAMYVSRFEKATHSFLEPGMWLSSNESSRVFDGGALEGMTCS